MTNLRKLVLTVLVLLMCSVFFSTALPAQKVSLREAWWGSQDRHNRTLGVIELF